MTATFFLKLFLYHCAFAAGQPHSTDIYLSMQAGPVDEYTIRQGQTAAHIYLDSTHDPYLFVAFPAGNSGVGLWFHSSDAPSILEGASRPQALDKEGGLHGVTLDLKTGAHSLRLLDSVLGSMRFIRDRELGIAAPKEVQSPAPSFAGQELRFQRRSLNGLANYEIDVMPLGETRIKKSGEGISLYSPSAVRFRIRAFTSEKPVTPIDPASVFQPKFLKSLNPQELQSFSFLLYKEKLMAGSPRYLSKFGRDSVYTLHALMAVLRPETLEDELVAILSSSQPEKGWISHEQSEGDFASFDRLRRHANTLGVSEPLEDYKMIDEDFAFAALVGEYLNLYPKRSAAFLARKDQRGLPVRDLVRSNFENVIKASAAFAKNPQFRNLIRLRPNETVGNWRDSENGLGGGVYPFDVNAAFVPAALHELERVYQANSGVFHDKEKATALGQAFKIWNTKVVPLFLVKYPAHELAKYGEALWKELGPGAGPIPPAPAEDLEFPAISLSDDGKPVPILHSDESLLMAFGAPSPDVLRTIPKRFLLPFPYGLLTPAGILVSDPLFSSAEWRKRFDETKYHGRVIWAMQENFLLLGLRRQLERGDLDPALRASLEKTESAVEKVIRSRSALAGTELLSLTYKDGKAVAAPFAGDAKANSIQLWSYLRFLLQP
ncbi:MAG: hypothetical protein ACXWR1_04785 [Bdellovibrionota bacterium]